MSDFFQLQERMQAYLLSNQVDIEQYITETETVSIQTRLGIYHNAYHARLIEALASNFPYLNVYLGDEAFHQMSLAYIKSHPSTFRSIRWYGDELATYLKTYFDSEQHYLCELAEFEWNMTLAFDASDDSSFQIEQMAVIPAQAWGEMELVAHPSLRRMNFIWDVVAIWEAMAKGQRVKNVIQHADLVPWVLWRHEYLNRFYSLPPDEVWAMDAMLGKASFGDICEGLCQWHVEDTVGMRAASLLKGWIKAGLLSGILF